MSRVSLGLLFVAAITLGACADQPAATGPSVTDNAALFDRGNGGGIGNPHFTGATKCTFGTETGRLACDYQIAGLGASAEGIGSLIGNVMTSWDCVYPDSTKNYSREQIKVAIDFLYYADEAGNVKGHVEDTAKPSCNTKSGYKPDPTNVAFALNEHSSELTFPFFGEGSWTLAVITKTAMGDPKYIYFDGVWKPEVVM